MRVIDNIQFTELLKAAKVKSRLQRELRFTPDVYLWADLELLAVADRTGTKGVLVLDVDHSLFIVPYELLTKLADAGGRTRSIICDLCKTWQAGSMSARITFTRAADQHTFTFLCCADLACSLHVRNLTPQALLSRTQLHEDLTSNQRVARLCLKLQELMALIQCQPTQL